MINICKKSTYLKFGSFDIEGEVVDCPVAFVKIKITSNILRILVPF